MENQLTKVIEQSGLEQTKAQVLLEQFSNYFEITAEWERKANEINVTDVSQVAEMKMARVGRLFLKDKRVAVEHTRKSLKESALREGQTIDAIAKILTSLIQPIEEKLEKEEKFAEIQEAKRKAQLKADREAELLPLHEFIPLGLDLANMTDTDYSKILAGAKSQMQAKIDAEVRAEEDRKERERIEAEERERVRLENERLKKEAEEKDRLLAEEKARVEAELKAIEEKSRVEKEEAERLLEEERRAAKIEVDRIKAEKAELEMQLHEQKEAEEKARRDAEKNAEAESKEKEEADRRAKNAPDKEKLIAFAEKLQAIEFPDITGDDAIEIIHNAEKLVKKIVSYIEEKATTL